jgi:hypothetical protein
VLDIERERIEQLCVALESGKYPQGQSTLRKLAGYCCLGVACDVSRLSRWSTVSNDNGSFSYGPSGEVSYLPDIVANWYGWASKNPMLKTPSGEYRSMSAMNDDYNYSFTEIAAALRRTYLIDVVPVADEVTDGGE